ncbi:MAG: rod shape-determining protein, partial [Planctomycetota bacterium]
MSETVFIGMDLGTSRTSITTSTGVRTTVWSYVGYALDHVSQKHLGGRDKVFGQEAVENRMAVNLVRPLDKGVIREDEDSRRAVRDLLEHIILEAGIPSGSTIYGVIGAPAEASVDSKAHILSAASEFMDSIIVCSEPFSVAYGLDFLSDTLVVDIGAGTVDLCRVHGTMPKAQDQRTHHYAGDAIDARLSELLTENHPEAQFSSNMVREIKENYACVGSHMDPVNVTFPVQGKPT